MKVAAGGLVKVPFLTVSSRGGRGAGALQGLFYNRTHPTQEGSTLVTESPPKGPPPNTSTLGLRFRHLYFRGTQSFIVAPFIHPSIHPSIHPPIYPSVCASEASRTSVHAV